jgi:hypothetical protein
VLPSSTSDGLSNPRALEVRDDGRPVALGGEKQRTLLAALLLGANRVVPRERARDLLERARATYGDLGMATWAREAASQ